jgi:quinol monooxygenase YgiN
MSLIAIIGQFDIDPADTASAAENMRTMMIETQKEQGCMHYAFSTDLAKADRFQLSELWESDDALAAHFKSAHMATFRAAMAQLRVVQRTVRRYFASEPTAL